jgi:hypothetical protein
MLQPAGWDSNSQWPKLCRNCKHAEMYHIKRKKEDKNARRSKTGKGSAASSAANTARGTARGSARGSGSASAKKSGSASAKKKK